MAKYLVPDFCIVEDPIIEDIEPTFVIGGEFVDVRCTIVS